MATACMNLQAVLHLRCRRKSSLTLKSILSMKKCVLAGVYCLFYNFDTINLLLWIDEL
jgi:hypothetical protein